MIRDGGDTRHRIRAIDAFHLFQARKKGSRTQRDIKSAYCNTSMNVQPCYVENIFYFKD